jgi:hypothetical protein
VKGNVPVDSDTLLVTDFVNLKIKPVQSFGSAHRGKMYIRIFIGVDDYTCMNICIYTVFQKKHGPSYCVHVQNHDINKLYSFFPCHKRQGNTSSHVTRNCLNHMESEN